MVIAPQPGGDSAESTSESPTLYRTGALMSLLRLRWFIHLRWGFIVVAGVLLVAERVVRPQSPRPGVLALVAVILVVAVVNVLWMVVSHTLLRRSDAAAQGDDEQTVRGGLVFANAQVAVDLLLLTAIIRYTGGVETPMVVFYLFHMAIGSLVLRAKHALLQGAWAMVLFSALGLAELREWVSPHYALLPSLSASALYSQPYYVAVVIVILGAGVFGTLFFMLRVADRLDAGERELRQAHDALQLSQRTIFDLQARRSRFMTTAAHQLKGPLAGIQTLTGLIRDGVVHGETLGSTCAKIIRRCREGIAQVTELLTLARMQGTDSRRQRDQVTDVGEVVEEVCRRFLPLAEEKEIALERHVHGNLGLSACVHRADLSDCVGNLVDNAIKYTPGGGKVTVKVGRGTPGAGTTGLVPVATELTSANPSVYVTVRDTGMGIEPAALTGAEGPGGAGSIFDAFRRGHGALAAGIPGTGLGLSIVREVVEQAGGQIYALSRPGEGTMFTVMLPAHEVTPSGPAVRDTRSSEIVIETAKPGGGPLIAADPEKANHAG